MHRIRTAFVAGAVALLAVAAQAAIDNNVRRTFNVAEGGTLIVDADAGDITINPGGSGVSVDIKRRARTSSQSKANELFQDYELTFAQEGNNVRVKGKYDRPNKWFNLFGDDLDVTFTISVPSRYNVQASSSGGDIRVGDLNGEVRAKTSGGDLDLGRIGGVVDARTSGGDVHIDGARAAVTLYTSGGDVSVGDAAGTVSARTSGGDIDVRHAAGNLFAHTSGGSITIEEARGTIDASTSGGSISARMAQQPNGESQLKSSGGGITLTVASNIAIDVDAHTSGGEIETDVPVTLLGKQSEGKLNGKLNGGGPRVVLRTSGGDIRLRKL
jgi:Putative adhesin